VSDLDGDAVKAFWAEAVRYARWEIGRYGRWREQDEPVLAGGYDAEGVVQAAFERLMQREAGSTAVEPRNLPIKSLLSPSVAKPLEGRPALSSTGREGAALGRETLSSAAVEAGSVSIFYSAEDIRHELRSLIKHRVRWLHERSETRLVVGEWDVLPPRPDGELVSIFDYLPGRIPRPDQELMRKEKEQLLSEFKAGFEATLARRPELLEVFRRVWDGKKRREIARDLGMKVGRVKALQAQLCRRLAKFSAEAQGGVAEVLGAKTGDVV